MKIAGSYEALNHEESKKSTRIESIGVTSNFPVGRKGFDRIMWKNSLTVSPNTNPVSNND